MNEMTSAAQEPRAPRECRSMVTSTLWMAKSIRLNNPALWAEICRRAEAAEQEAAGA